MVLETIYLTRHGFRANWVTAPPRLQHSGRLSPDTPLSEHGEQQAEELGAHLSSLVPLVDTIYTSPFYRCVQTVEPAVRRLGTDHHRVVEINGEPGLGEWYGTNRSNDPVPAAAEVLRTFFPAYSTSYHSICTPNASGESIEELHDRCAYVMAHMIEKLDADPTAPKSVLICTHAATAIAIARVLTGTRPASPTQADFIPWTAGLFTFRRRTMALAHLPPIATTAQLLPRMQRQDGAGIGGGWDCTVNADCSFLSKGQQRGWRFSGKEIFSHAVVSHGVDAGSGLGVVIEPEQSDVEQ